MTALMGDPLAERINFAKMMVRNQALAWLVKT